MKKKKKEREGLVSQFKGFQGYVLKYHEALLCLSTMASKSKAR